MQEIDRTERDAQAAHHRALARAEMDNAALVPQVLERWYPRFHIAAAAGWINDPNGLCWFRGRYHVFFQHHPADTSWGPMHWGHVSSPDLVEWRREPIALAPSLEEDRDGVFSGSAVEGPDGRLYVFYTGHRWCNGRDEAEGNLQVQCLAVSDDGVNFSKLGVVVEGPPEVPHFRDPKVWKQDGRWFMVFGVSSAQNRGEVWLYESDDLLDWSFSEVVYRDPDPSAFMLECPDLFPLGDHWVLLYCPMGPSPQGYRARNGHNAGYVVGDWSAGQPFEALTAFRPLDWGHNFYAPQTFLAPDGRRLMFGWMGAFTTPLAPQERDQWSGQLTVPRVLELDDRLRLVNKPIEEINRMHGATVLEQTEVLLEANTERVLAKDLPVADILMEVDLKATTAERFGFSVGRTPSGAEAAYVCWDDLAQRLVVDRRNTAYGDRGLRGAPGHQGETLEMRVLLDRGSVEVFLDGGCESVSSFAFPAEGDRSLSLVAESGELVVRSLSVRRMGSIWASE